MKKILYVPGMISALLIPAVFWFYGSQSIKKTYTVMDLGLPAKIKKGVENAPDSFESVRHWKYKKIMVRAIPRCSIVPIMFRSLKNSRPEKEKKPESSL